MPSSVLLAGVQTSLNYQSAIGQIMAILANYGLTLPTAADQTTGQLSSSQVTALLASISPGLPQWGPDSNGKRAADAATLSQLLQFAGLSGSALSALPTTLSGTSGTLNSTNQVINPSGTFTLTLPAPSTMSGQTVTLKSIAAQIVNSASANVVPIGGGAAAAAIFPATANKFATLVSDNVNWNVMAGN